MLQLLIAFAGILVGISTGIEMRRTLHPVTGTGMTAYFPGLSVAAALVAGAALAQSTLIALTGRWPQLVPFITGPLLAGYGFVWFQNSLATHRLAFQQTRESGTSQRPTVPTAAATMTHVGLGVQMGLLLC